MEALLSLSFDNISSTNPSKIRKGLRQIEGLLAQICLAKSRTKAPRQLGLSDEPGTIKNLTQVADDPAFREFFRLQQGFEWNVAMRLITCLERLLGMPNNDSTNALILSTLDLFQGILLLHPPSRTLFGQEIYMTTLLDLLDASNPPQLQSQTLLVLVSALLGSPSNTRAFERLDGLLTISSLFKARSTSKEVKMKAIEFFYFYLMPESSASPLEPEVRLVNGSDKDRRRPSLSNTKSTQDKQQMLGQHLSNVAELVQDLREAAPFEIAV